MTSISSIDLLGIDLLGTFAFAITGAVKASHRDLDWFGIVALACCTGVCGGVMRDILLGNAPPVALQKPIYIILCISAAIFVIVAQKKIISHWRLVMIADAIGLGAFTAISAMYAENESAGALGIVSLAVVTSVGGGMLRDVLVGEIPQVLRREIYATAALVGGLFFLLFGLFTSEYYEIKFFSTIAITIAIRLFAMKAKLNMPK